MNFRIEMWQIWITVFYSNVAKASMKLHMSYNTVQSHILQKQTQFYEMFTSITIFSLWRIEISWKSLCSKTKSQIHWDSSSRLAPFRSVHAGIFVYKHVTILTLLHEKAKVWPKFRYFLKTRNLLRQFVNKDSSINKLA